MFRVKKCNTMPRQLLILFYLTTLSWSIAAQDATLVYQKVINSVMTIKGGGVIGSGFIVAPNVVVTNYHVVDGLKSAVCFNNKTGPQYKVDGFLSADMANDLVLLQVSGLNQKPLPLSSSCSEIGQRIYVIGSPKGLEGTITEGLVSAFRERYGVQQLQVSAAVSHGNSGGPVLNKSGEVVGVTVAKITTGENLNFAVPLDTLKKLMFSLPGMLQPLTKLPPMDLEDEAEEETDMKNAELIYDLGISHPELPLTLNYMAHFRDSTCFYFYYDMMDTDDSLLFEKVWLGDYRLVDTSTGEIIYASDSDLFCSTEEDPRIVYRGTRTFFTIRFPRLSPKVRNFHLMEGDCQQGAFCFRDIQLRNFKTLDGLDWYSYQNNNNEGTISFYTLSKEEKFAITVGDFDVGLLSLPWLDLEKRPSCGNTGESVVTARLPIGKYKYKAVSDKTTFEGEVEITREGCLVVELKKID
jgi:hypothetical protein